MKLVSLVVSLSPHHHTAAEEIAVTGCHMTEQVGVGQGQVGVGQGQFLSLLVAASAEQQVLRFAFEVGEMVEAVSVAFRPYLVMQQGLVDLVVP